MKRRAEHLSHLSLSILVAARQCNHSPGCDITMKVPSPSPPTQSLYLVWLHVSVRWTAFFTHYSLTFSQNCDVSSHFFANHSKYVSPVLSRHVFELRKKVNWLCCCWRLTKKKQPFWRQMQGGLLEEWTEDNVREVVYHLREYVLERTLTARGAPAEYREDKRQASVAICTIHATLHKQLLS